MIDLLHVDAGYGKSIKIQDINASFPKGEMTAIVGANGSGKSTMVKSVVGLCHVLGGTIRIHGEDAAKMNHKQVAKLISYLPQNRNLPAITAGKMVLHGRFPYLSYPRHYSELDWQCVRESMEQLGIWNLRHKLMAELSGGERQKVYLAMALAGETEILILDEPTTYLDISCQIEFMKILRTIKEEGRTVVAILHDLNAALQYADRILVMKDGRVSGIGTPSQMFDSRILEEAFGIQVHRFMDGEGKAHYYFD